MTTRFIKMKTTATIAVIAALALAACGGGSGSSVSYSLGGSVTGLGAGQSVELQDNGANDLSISANGAFTFSTSVAGGIVATIVGSPFTLGGSSIGFATL